MAHGVECGRMSNVMAALGIQVVLLKMTRSESSIILFLVPRRKVWLTPTARVPCSNAVHIGERKTWTQSEFCTGQNSVRAQ